MAAEYGGIYNLFTYISFRAVGAAVTALLISFIVGPMIVAALKRRAAHQVVREGTPDSHAVKGTTPTRGGIIILIAAVVPTLLWARLSGSRPYVYIAIFVTLWMGMIGLIDDLLMLKQKREGRENRGLVEAHKLIGQVTVGVVLGWWLWQHPISPLPGASTSLPFFKFVLIVPATFALGWLYVAFTT
ncbi:MAG TPA: phospho-N-acetylmuramoyl-pentapeptide-transferase, partial [Gemmatimonadaceae bacterium]|nr:phospho-N-acetylmuramoyl-pentapeptide-transferase [Gemmatimonadaceae bacterium]